MYTLVDGVEFYDKDEIDTIVKSITGGTIPDEENIRTELTTKIAEEAEARAAADATISTELGARIDEEATKRMDADALFSKLIAGEVESRTNVDTAFANQLAAIEQLHTTLISPNGFIDSDGDAVNVNDSGKSIRQIAHEEFYRQLITDADDVKAQLDTLKELADYLQRNPSIIADMYNKLGITWSIDNPTDFGTFDFSTVLTATTIDDAVLELYNTFTNKIGDLAQLTTTFKDNIVGAINELNAEIDAEVTARTDADTALGTRIDEEATARTDADIALGTRIDEEVTARTDADAAIGTRIDEEVTARTDADTALGARIDEEATARTDADTALDTKIGDLTQLDTTSKDTIVSAINSEFEWRRKNDEALGARIDEEVTARTDTDTALDTRIDEEATARTDADTALGTRIDEEVGDLDSLKTTDKSSAVAAINELYDTVQQCGGGGDGPVPTPSTDGPYVIEITTDTLDRPATIQGDLPLEVVTGIQDAVAANKTLALKLISTDDPATYMFVPMYSSVNGGYTFVSSTTAVQDTTITIGTYVVQVQLDTANYYGQYTHKNVAIPEGGSTNVYVLQLTYDVEFNPPFDATIALTPEQNAAVTDAITNRVPIIAIVISVSGASSVLTPILTTTRFGGVFSNTLMELSGPGTPSATTMRLNLDLDAGRAELKYEQAALGGGSGNTAADCEQFAFVVDSNEKLAEWANNDRSKGQDYTSVLIRKGEWTSTVGVNLTTAGTKVVKGEAGNKLKFADVEMGLFYDPVPKGSEYYMVGINLANTSTGNENCFGFFNCINLTNCTGIGTSTGTSIDAGNGYCFGFSRCNNLTNCTGMGTVTNVFTAEGAGFFNCINLTNCTGIGKVTSVKMAEGAGFKKCNNLTNCTGTGTGTGTNAAYGVGFIFCNCVYHCKAGNKCTVEVFGNCYASNSESSTYACADTANGGFNNVTNPSV